MNLRNSKFQFLKLNMSFSPDKCVSQNTEIIGGFIKSIDGAQHIGECVRLCSAVEACIGWTYLSSTAECVLVDESHERTSKLVGAVSGFLLCDKDDKDDMVSRGTVICG